MTDSPETATPETKPYRNHCSQNGEFGYGEGNFILYNEAAEARDCLCGGKDIKAHLTCETRKERETR